MAEDTPYDGLQDELDAELGRPIAELLDLDVDPDPGLVRRVLGSIRRRDLTSQLATLWWSGVAEMFSEILQLIAGLAVANRPTEEGEQT